MPLSLRCPSTLPSVSCTRQFIKASPSTRSFTTTTRRAAGRATRARRGLWIWLNTNGAVFKNPLSGSTNYLGAYNAAGELKRGVNNDKKDGNTQDEGARRKAIGQVGKTEGQRPSRSVASPTDLVPFPLNKSFRSQAVLSEELREEVWSRIMTEGKSVRQVSAELGVEMARVGAVVRLLEIEKEWKRIGKPLARPYAQAVMGMLPKTPYHPGTNTPHESINDLPVHAYTGQQIFLPTSESRHFTRADAAKVFHEKLLPADDRVPHPELAIMHKELISGLSADQRAKLNEARDEAAEEKRRVAAEREAKKESKIKKVDSPRWEFRITPINVDDAGKDGRGYKGVGWRYGMPHMDRSRGAQRIPTSVE